MIQFTGNKNLKSETEVQQRPKGMEKPWAFGVICKSGIMLAMIFSACGMRVYFSDKTDRLTRQAGEIRSEMKRMNLEIQNLTVKREHMHSLKYIQSKIALYKLNLRPTAANQIHYLKYYQEAPEAQERNGMQVAENNSLSKEKTAEFRTAFIR